MRGYSDLDKTGDKIKICQASEYVVCQFSTFTAGSTCNVCVN